MAPLKKILVIEDDRDIRESLMEILDTEGFSVECATNGQEGLERMRGPNRPDLILLDLMMPVKDGFEFRRDQLADPAFKDIPVIIMSADGRINDKKNQVQGVEYLRKPVDLDQLVGAVRKYT